VRVEHFLDGVQRAGADVAEHHADRGHHQGREPELGMSVRLRGLRRAWMLV